MDKRLTHHNYFFIQQLVEDGNHLTVYHTIDEESGDVYNKFITRTSANKFLKEQKEEHPENKYRVVRLRERYFASEWE